MNGKVYLLTMIFTKKNFLIFFYVLVIGTSGYKFSFLANFAPNFQKSSTRLIMRMRGYAMCMRSSSNEVMRMRSVQGITLLLELRMRTTWLRIRIIDLEELFWEFTRNWPKNWIYTRSSRSPKRKKNQKIVLSENHGQ